MPFSIIMKITIVYKRLTVGLHTIVVSHDDKNTNRIRSNILLQHGYPS